MTGPPPSPLPLASPCFHSLATTASTSSPTSATTASPTYCQPQCPPCQDALSPSTRCWRTPHADPAPPSRPRPLPRPLPRPRKQRTKTPTQFSPPCVHVQRNFSTYDVFPPRLALTRSSSPTSMRLSLLLLAAAASTCTAIHPLTTPSSPSSPSVLPPVTGTHTARPSPPLAPAFHCAALA